MKRKSYSSGCVEHGLDLKHFFFFPNRPYSDVGGSRGEEKSSALDIRGKDGNGSGFDPTR